MINPIDIVPDIHLEVVGGQIINPKDISSVLPQSGIKYSTKVVLGLVATIILFATLAHFIIGQRKNQVDRPGEH
jgi:hypothetical protein